MSRQVSGPAVYDNATYTITLFKNICDFLNKNNNEFFSSVFNLSSCSIKQFRCSDQDFLRKY